MNHEHHEYGVQHVEYDMPLVEIVEFVGDEGETWLEVEVNATSRDELRTVYEGIGQFLAEAELNDQIGGK